MTISKPNILVVLTNTREFPSSMETSSQNTGFDIKELAYLHEYLCVQHNMNVTLASPKGGECFIDSLSMEMNKDDEIVKKFLKDSKAKDKIKKTLSIIDVRKEEFTAAIFPGGSGVLYDLPNCNLISEMINDIYARHESFIATIGHGLAALINVQTEKREPWLKNKRVTCQTLEEEREMKLERVLPYMVEDKLKQIGAKFEKSSSFKPHVVEDERLITAQNSCSTKEWVEVIVKHLKSNV